MFLFYSSTAQGSLHFFNEEESKHCIQVLRRSTGDAIQWTDGLGSMYIGHIVAADKRRMSAEVEKASELHQRGKPVHLYVAPTKQIDRLEWAIEKCVEIGIHSFTPLFCEHSERTRLRMDRIEKIVLSAVKQSTQAWLPNLNEPQSFSSCMQNVVKDSTNQFLMGYCGEAESKDLTQVVQPGLQTHLFIGPEGDFSKEEVQLALSKGVHLIGLGQNRLRTETAAVVGTTLLQWHL